jgi:glycosyltransferase involved in cell wall biosynthesis
MKILLINPLDERSGLKVRARGFYAILKVLKYDVSYMESNYKGDDPLIISIPQKDTLSGYFIACIKRLKYCLLMSYDLLLIHKFLPVNVPCIIAGKIRGKKVLVDWDDFDYTYQPTWFRRTITKWAEQWMPGYVDLITTHNHGIKEHAEKIGAKKVSIIPQGIDTKVFDPDKYNNNELRAGLGLKGKKVICCLCTLDWGGARDLDNIFLAVSQAIKKREDIMLLIIGGGILEERFRRMAANLEITQVLFTGLISQDEVAQHLAASDLALIYMSDDVGNRMRFSLKLLEYLSMRKIVVGHLVGPSRDYFSDYCVLAHSDIKDFSEKIMEVLNATPNVKDARSYIVENYDWEVVQKSIKEALSEIM